MGKRLRELEADRQKERRDAAKWYAKHANEVGKVFDPEEARVTGADGVQRSREVPMDSTFEGVVVHQEASRFEPLVANLYPRWEDEERERLNMKVEYIMSLLPESQQDLLYNYIIEGQTQQALANHGESRQAVQQRLARARAAFERLWKEHYGEAT